MAKIRKKVKKGNGPVEIVLLSIVSFILICTFILPWYLPLWGVVLAFIILGFVLIFAGSTTLLISIIPILPNAFLDLSPILAIAISVAIISVGGLMLIANYYIAKAFGYATFYFSKWLTSLIKGV